MAGGPGALIPSVRVDARLDVHYRRRGRTLITVLQWNAMSMKRRLSRISLAILFLSVLSVATYVDAESAPMIMERYAIANGVKLHYLVAGKGSPVILLHGYAQNQPHVASAHEGAGQDPPRGGARLTRLWR